jgi:hypothetical protein
MFANVSGMGVIREAGGSGAVVRGAGLRGQLLDAGTLSVMDLL